MKNRAKQKAKENRIKRNARNMKSPSGIKLLDRTDRLMEVKRRVDE